MGDAKTIEYLGRHPDKLLSLSSRQFEDLVVELLGREGYAVGERAATHDILAFSKGDPPVKHVVQCRRYSPKNVVGPGDVRELLDKTLRQKAAKGILVTTTHFSGPARRILAQHSRSLEGRDCDDLVRWLREPGPA